MNLSPVQLPSYSNPYLYIQQQPIPIPSLAPPPELTINSSYSPPLSSPSTSAPSSPFQAFPFQSSSPSQISTSPSQVATASHSPSTSITASSQVAIGACTECKQRKKKCVGNPCTYCVKKGTACVFVHYKKRGPVAKKVKTIGNSITEIVDTKFSSYMNSIQESMCKLYNQNNFVEFYFEFIGTILPVECKNPLTVALKSPQLTAQMCIIGANIMKVFGNKSMETQYIEEAQRYIGNLLDCDNIESAVSMTMMCQYSGIGNPKALFYANMAQNIVKLPAVYTTWLARKLEHCAAMLLVIYDPAPTQYEKSTKLLTMYPPLEEFDTIEIPIIERIKVVMSKVRSMFVVLLKIDLANIAKLTQSLVLPPISPEVKASVLAELQKLDDMQKQTEIGSPIQACAEYNVALGKCLVAWRSGEPQEAFSFALTALQVFKRYNCIIALWYYKMVSQLLLLPCYFNCNGENALKLEFLAYCKDAFEKLGHTSEFIISCEQLNLKKLATTDNIAQIEQELLNTNGPESPSVAPVQNDVLWDSIFNVFHTQ